MWINWPAELVGVVSLVLTACTSAGVTTQPLAKSASSSSSEEVNSREKGALSCKGQGSSNLPGVHIEFTSSRCSWSVAEARAGLQIDYQVHIDQELSGVVPLPHSPTHCDLPGPSGLIVFEDLHGDGQRYCVCDQGLCADPPEDPIQLHKGVYEQTFKWRGKNWLGPSDTLNPEGEPFPAGRYTLTVSTVGRWQGAGEEADFEVVGMFTIDLHE
jgi:hypothetical protein